MLVGVYADEGISGTFLNHREAFARMIDDAMNGKIDLIITKSLSRFARNTVDALNIIRKLKLKNVGVYFEKEDISTLDSKGEFLLTLMSSLAEEESRSISENVRWGQRKRFADGRYHMPYKQFLGYKKGVNGEPELVEDEAKIIRIIYRLHLEGYTPSSIAKQLTEAKVPTPSGLSIWQRHTVKSILQNEKYYGAALLQKKFCVDYRTKTMRKNQGELPMYYVENGHEGIVTKEIFDAVQKKIPGEDAEGVMTAVDFLCTVGADESYPVTGKAVVVGGGNVAIDVARTAQRCGAESVAMFCLEPRDKMPASEEEIAEALEEDVTIDCGWGPKEILTENGKVIGIVFKRCVSVWNAEGKFAPTYDENDTKTVPCDRVFLSIGQSILWGDLLKGSKVELGRGNGAVADSLTYQTAEPDIFVGGDVYTGPKFAIDAIAAGREGAISIHRFVQPHSSLTIGRNRREFIALDKDNIKVEQYDNSSRQIPGTRKDIDHKKSFRDAKLPFTEEQVAAETARCLGCGASVVDPNKCIGCGICTTKCEFGAIKLHRERPECSNMIPSEKKLPYVLGNGAKQALKIKFSKKKEQ